MSKVAKATIGLMMATIIAKVLGFGRELVLASSYGASMYSDAYLTAINIQVAKATIGLMIATIIAKVLGFGRELVLASAYGASMYSDAYLTAMNIPTVLFTIIGSTLGTVLIPMYFEVNCDLGEKKALNFINNVFNIVIVMCILLAILGFIFTEQIVKVFAMGFEGKTLKISIDFTRITIIGIVFTGLSYVMTAYLQIKNNFAVPGFISVPKNIIIIIFNNT